MQEIQGYRVIPLQIYKMAKTSHKVFVKENTTKVKDPQKPPGRTLFIMNIPPYVTEDNLKFGFKNIGEVLSVHFQSKPGKNDEPSELTDKFTAKRAPFTFKVAYIVFKSTKSLQAALQLKSIYLFVDEETPKTKPSDLRNWAKDTVINCGVEKWTAEFLSGVENEDTLQAEIEKYMEVYNKKEQAALEAEKSQGADDDGWITVTKSGRNAGFEQKQSVIGKLEEKMERSRKKKELTNFYTFQIRESKMQNIVSLRKKFEEDKNRIETLKKTRRFKPF